MNFKKSFFFLIASISLVVVGCKSSEVKQQTAIKQSKVEVIAKIIFNPIFDN